MTATSFTQFLAVCLVTPLGASFVLFIISDWRYSYRAIVRVFCTVEIVHIPLCVLVYLLLGSTKESRTFLGMAPALIYMGLFLFLTRYRDGRAAFSLVSNLLLATIGSSLCSLAAPYGSPLWLVLWLCFAAVTLFLLRLFRGPFQAMLRQAEHGWIKLCVLPVSLFTCFLSLTIYPIYSGDNTPIFRTGTLLLCVLSVLVYVALYQFLKAMRAQYSVQQDVDLLRAQMSALEQQTSQAAEEEQKNRIYRHDQRHFLQILRSGAAAGDLETVVSVLDSMGRKLDELESGAVVHSFTGQPLLDTVLSIGLRRAQAQGTELTIQMALPSHWEANLTEFAVVVSNALENALKACAQLPEGRPRKIELLGKNTPGQFFFAVSNTFTGTVQWDEAGCPIPSVTGDHGFGTRSIAAFAAKYNGLVQYSSKDGWFYLRLLF